MIDWTTIEQERSGIPNRTFYKVLCLRYGLCEWSLVGEAGGDGCRNGAPPVSYTPLTLPSTPYV